MLFLNKRKKIKAEIGQISTFYFFGADEVVIYNFFGSLKS